MRFDFRYCSFRRKEYLGEGKGYGRRCVILEMYMILKFRVYVVLFWWVVEGK